MTTSGSEGRPATPKDTSPARGSSGNTQQEVKDLHNPDSITRPTLESNLQENASSGQRKPSVGFSGGPAAEKHGYSTRNVYASPERAKEHLFPSGEGEDSRMTGTSMARTMAAASAQAAFLCQNQDQSTASKKPTMVKKSGCSGDQHAAGMPKSITGSTSSIPPTSPMRVRTETTQYRTPEATQDVENRGSSMRRRKRHDNVAANSPGRDNQESAVPTRLTYQEEDVPRDAPASLMGSSAMVMNKILRFPEEEDLGDALEALAPILAKAVWRAVERSFRYHDVRRVCEEVHREFNQALSTSEQNIPEYGKELYIGSKVLHQLGFEDQFSSSYKNSAYVEADTVMRSANQILVGIDQNGTVPQSANAATKDSLCAEICFLVDAKEAVATDVIRVLDFALRQGRKMELEFEASSVEVCRDIQRLKKNPKTQAFLVGASTIIHAFLDEEDEQALVRYKTGPVEDMSLQDVQDWKLQDFKHLRNNIFETLLFMTWLALSAFKWFWETKRKAIYGSFVTVTILYELFVFRYKCMTKKGWRIKLFSFGLLVFRGFVSCMPYTDIWYAKKHRREQLTPADVGAACALYTVAHLLQYIIFEKPHSCRMFVRSLVEVYIAYSDNNGRSREDQLEEAKKNLKLIGGLISMGMAWFLGFIPSLSLQHQMSEDMKADGVPDYVETIQNAAFYGKFFFGAPFMGFGVKKLWAAYGNNKEKAEASSQASG